MFLAKVLGLFFCGFFCQALCASYLVTVPVADLTTQRIRPSCFDTFPFSPQKGPTACLRSHQILFNEIVTVHKELPSSEVLVTLDDLFYVDSWGHKRSEFWLLKKNLLPLDTVPKELVPRFSDRTVALREPWYDIVTQRSYSVGTRFVKTEQQSKKDMVGVQFYDPLKQQKVVGWIPKELLFVPPSKNFTEQRRSFLEILGRWAHLEQGFIPYVFGGASFDTPWFSEGFKLVHGRLCGKWAYYWERPDYTRPVKSGFDCTTLILRAAELAGLPYFYKNTHTLASLMKPLQEGEPLEEGDLVWYDGHVLVVYDLKKNTLIEAIGYEAGYGKVHEIPVHLVFKECKDLKDLVPVHLTHRTTHRLDVHGKPYRALKRIKILKLNSINAS